MFPIEFDQAVCLQQLQPIPLPREVFIEGYGVSSLNRGHIDESVTHDLVDHVSANSVVTTHGSPTVRRQRAARDRGFVVRERFVILNVQIAYLTDRTDTKGDEVPIGVSRIPLKAAVQGAVLLRESQ